MIKNSNKDRIFGYFMGQIMSVGIDYDNNTERKNTSDSILGVASEEENIVDNSHKIYHTVRKSGRVGGKIKLFFPIYHRSVFSHIRKIKPNI